MRRWTWAAGIVVSLGLARPASAQVFLGSATRPGSVVNQPISTSASVAPIPPNRLGSFNLQGVFHSFSGFFGGPPTVGQSPLPQPSRYLSTHYPSGFNPYVPMK